jgi:hypothetical protein
MPVASDIVMTMTTGVVVLRYVTTWMDRRRRWGGTTEEGLTDRSTGTLDSGTARDVAREVAKTPAYRRTRR